LPAFCAHVARGEDIEPAEPAQESAAVAPSRRRAGARTVLLSAPSKGAKWRRSFTA
jgi:hypothetical protein